MSNQQHKKLLKARKALEPILVRHNLTPIEEMNFIGYRILANKPPEGNLRMTRMFFMEVERRGRMAAKRAGVELKCVFLNLHRELTKVYMTGDRYRRVEDKDSSHLLSIEYWGEGIVHLHEPRSPVAGTLYEEYNDMFVKPLGLAPHFELADFLVHAEDPYKFATPGAVLLDSYRDHYPMWIPLNTIPSTYSAAQLADVKNWT